LCFYDKSDAHKDELFFSGRKGGRERGRERERERGREREREERESAASNADFPARSTSRTLHVKAKI
jgi:hypothetical protein